MSPSASDPNRYGSYEFPAVLGFFKLKVSRSAQYILLTVLATLFSVIFSVLQERVFLFPGFNFSGYTTFLQYLTYAVCGKIESLPHQGLSFRLNAPLLQYAYVAAASVTGLWCTNAALVYIDFVTKIVFKSIKVLPVFVFAALVQGRAYTRRFYATIGLLSAGLVIFLLEESGASSRGSLKPIMSTIGITLISFSLICDSLYANLEEKFFFKGQAKPVEPSEIMMVTSLLAAGALLPVLIISGELKEGIAHTQLNSGILLSIISSAAAGYVAASLYLTLIKHFGAGNTEIAKSLRKIVQVVFSILVFHKAVGVYMMLGLLIVACALALINYLYHTGNAVVSSPLPPPPEDNEVWKGAIKLGGEGGAKEGKEGVGGEVRVAVAGGGVIGASPRAAINTKFFGVLAKP